MKTLMLISAIVSSQAFAGENNPALEKSADGKTANCLSAANFGTTAFRPSKALFRVEDDEIKLRINITHLLCAHGQNKLDWAKYELPANSQNEYRFLILNGQGQILGEVSATGESTQVLEFTLSLRNALGQEEWARLDDGESTLVKWELVLEGKRFAWSQNDVQAELFRSGSYVLKFSLSHSGSEYVVTKAKARRAQ